MYFEEIIAAQKKGDRRGIPSICSANPWVIQSALRYHERVLIEATCNQVNQFGGYTGMTPGDFIRYVRRIASDNAVPEERIIFGGDHLGPNVWKTESAVLAMQKSEALIRDYIKAGFTKIHIDCSMPLGGDGEVPLPPELIAERTARLVRVAEVSVDEGQPQPRYVIGTEVPIPGGAFQDKNELHVTRVDDLKETLEISDRTFQQAGLDAAWERIIAVVVQPGVEFGNNHVIRFDRALAKDLSNFIENQDFVYEAHSTDYQDRSALMSLVEDHFAILKVGPALTFAFREAVFSLEKIEQELIPEDHRSNLFNVIEGEMVKAPKYWHEYYSGTEAEIRLARRSSLSDRMRYYWNRPPVEEAMKRLFQNLFDKSVPLSLLRQNGISQREETPLYRTKMKPELIIMDRINEVLNDYYAACEPDKEAQENNLQ